MIGKKNKEDFGTLGQFLTKQRVLFFFSPWFSIDLNLSVSTSVIPEKKIMFEAKYSKNG